jgi:hypothetical protein
MLHFWMTKRAPENQKLFVRHAKAAVETMEDTIIRYTKLKWIPHCIQMIA